MATPRSAEAKNVLRSSAGGRAKKDAKHNRMYYAYILRSQVDPSQIYKGLTEDIAKRLDYHNSGKVYHTAKFKPWKMIFYAAFETRERAADFEKYLKTASGIAFLRKRLINS